MDRGEWMEMLLVRGPESSRALEVGIYVSVEIAASPEVVPNLGAQLHWHTKVTRHLIQSVKNQANKCQLIKVDHKWKVHHLSNYTLTYQQIVAHHQEDILTDHASTVQLFMHR